MIELLIYLLVLCIVFGLLYYVVGLLPLPEPFKKIAVICVLVIFIIILLYLLVGSVKLPRIP